MFLLFVLHKHIKTCTKQYKNKNSFHKSCNILHVLTKNDIWFILISAFHSKGRKEVLNERFAYVVKAYNTLFDCKVFK